ncbi:MAG: low molecular weight phosphotyrosine protein phosphatase [Prevotella sp.]|nr:low molecular weight phosphotyrosine protein phosphatase [Prevotella sp.]
MKILFVCHGNICRSPMAEYIMKHLVDEAHLSGEYEIASAATSTEELGNPVYPPARRKLAEHGIGCEGHHARQLTRADYQHYDLLIGMDQYNIRNMERMCGGDPEGKIHLLLDYVEGRQSESVADPWYTGDFEATWRDCLAGCKALLAVHNSQFTVSC